MVKKDSSTESVPQRLRDRMRAVAANTILDAAEQVVAEQGSEGAKIEEIAKRAGVAVGTVYNYYADRDTLMAALRVARKQELFEALTASIDDHAEQPFGTQLEAFLRAMLGYYERHRQFFGSLLSSAEGQSKMHHAGAEILRELFCLPERLVKVGVEQKVLREEYADLYSPMIFALVRAASISALQKKRTAPLTEMVGPLVDLFLHGAEKTE